MKSIVIALAATLICATSASATQHTITFPASRDHAEVTIVFEPGEANLNLGQLRAFDEAQHADPGIARDLATKPSLVASEDYIARHPALQQFLSLYPSAREEIEENPGNYVVPLPGSAWDRSLFRAAGDSTDAVRVARRYVGAR